MAVMTCFAAFAAPASGQTSDILFPDELWRKDLLSILERGPVRLERDLDMGVEPPLRNDDPETIMELDRLEHMLPGLRTDEQVRLIHLENEMGIIDLYYVLGAIPSIEKAPSVYRILSAALQEADFFIMREKKKYMRARPTQLRPGLTALIDIPGHPAYPSGHASQAYLFAGILSEMFPRCEDSYRSMSAMIAFRREVAGVHFSSDTVAGAVLAKNLLDALKDLPEYKDAIEMGAAEMSPFASKIGCPNTGGFK